MQAHVTIDIEPNDLPRILELRIPFSVRGGTTTSGTKTVAAASPRVGRQTPATGHRVQVLSAIGNALSLPAIAEKTGLTRDVVRTELQALYAAKQVRKVGKGAGMKYRAITN